MGCWWLACQQPGSSGVSPPHWCLRLLEWKIRTLFDLDRSKGKNAQIVSEDAGDSTGTRTPTAWFLSVVGDCGGRCLPGRDQAVQVEPVVACGAVARFRRSVWQRKGRLCVPSGSEG